MAPMSGAEPLSSFGSSTINAPMVEAVAAIETAFCKASLVTLVGSIMPFAFRSTSLSGLMTSIPKPGLAARTCGSHSSAFNPELVRSVLKGSSRSS